MTTLVTCLSKGYGQHVLNLIKLHDWDQTYIVTGIKDKFDIPKGVELIVIDEAKPLAGLVEDISGQLKINGFEVAVNISAGTGKEHMAVLSAVLRQGLALRFVDVGNGEIIEI